jgi:hypothetical protein
MIDLKRNDRLIIIIAVIVIIIAVIGIAAYRPPTPAPFEEEIEEEKVFSVEWNITKGSLPPIEEFVSKRSPYEDSATIHQGNLKSVTFNLSWVDDRAPFFGRFGLDTLSLEVITPDGGKDFREGKSAPGTREGSVKITFYTNFSPPEKVIAKDKAEAQKKVNEEYYSDKWVNDEFKIKITAKIGEKGILRRLLDKGNTFKLTITYEYYHVTVEEEETKETEFENKEIIEDRPPFLSIIIGTGCGRYI